MVSFMLRPLYPATNWIWESEIDQKGNWNKPDYGISFRRVIFTRTLVARCACQVQPLALRQYYGLCVGDGWPTTCRNVHQSEMQSKLAGAFMNVRDCVIKQYTRAHRPNFNQATDLPIPNSRTHSYYPPVSFGSLHFLTALCTKCSDFQSDWCAIRWLRGCEISGSHTVKLDKGKT
jgi:hypothetical protein